LLGLGARLVGVTGQNTLIEASTGVSGGRSPRMMSEEFQPLDVATQHDQAQRQRRRQNKADGPPQPGPERWCHDNRKRREPGALRVQHRLDGLAHDRLADGIERGRP
jgi:hypothetical protein